MVEYVWNETKAEILGSDATRSHVSFSECLTAIENGKVLNDIQHPTRIGQRIMILDIEDYAYVVPYVENDGVRFLKTVFPSRKYTQEYLR